MTPKAVHDLELESEPREKMAIRNIIVTVNEMEI